MSSTLSEAKEEPPKKRAYKRKPKVVTLSEAKEEPEPTLSVAEEVIEEPEPTVEPTVVAEAVKIPKKRVTRKVLRA